MKRTYQPHNKKRINKHGFRQRISTPNGRSIILRRIRKKRKFLTLSDRFLFKGQTIHGLKFKNSTSNRKTSSLKRQGSNSNTRQTKITQRKISAAK